MSIEKAINEAKALMSQEGGNWCVVERPDSEGGVFEHAVAPVGVSLGDGEKVVWPLRAYKFMFSENATTEDYAIREFPSLKDAATKEAVRRIWPNIWAGKKVNVMVVPCDSESDEGSASVDRFGVEFF